MAIRTEFRTVHDMAPTDLRAQAIAPLTEVRDNLSEFVDDVTATGSDLIITRHGRPAVVMVGFDEYEALIETLNILSDAVTMSAIDEAESDAEAGDLVDMD